MGRLRALYRTLGWLAPLVRQWWRRFGLGTSCRSGSPVCRTGRPNQTRQWLVVADGHWYLGHPDGPAHWTRNLDGARCLLT